MKRSLYSLCRILNSKDVTVKIQGVWKNTVFAINMEENVLKYAGVKIVTILMVKGKMTLRIRKVFD